MKISRRHFSIMILASAAVAGCTPAAAPAPTAKPAEAKPTTAPAAAASPAAVASPAAAASPAASAPPAASASPAAAPAASPSPAAAAPASAPAAAAKPTIPQPAAMTEATLLGSWFAQPEEGGYYFAEMAGLFKARNVDLTVKAGGPGVDVVKLVAVGQFKFGMAVSDQIALARNQDIPVVGIMSPFQKYPQIIMVHEESGVKSFEDMSAKGTRVAVSTTAVFAQYLRRKYNWKEEQLLRYNGQLAEWLNDKDRATQGLITNEPFVARKAGAKPFPILIGEASGYNPYQKMLFTTEEVIQKEPELVSAVVAGCIEGWRGYIESGGKTHEYLKTKNPDLVDDGMAYAYDAQKPLITGGDAEKFGVGVMTAERWDTLYKQMKEIELLKADLDPKAAWTDRFMKPLMKA